MSPMVETTTLGLIEQVGQDMHNNARCLVCGWAGKAGELATVPFKNPFGSGEAALESFGRDVLMTVVKECAEPLGRVLIRWGFMPGKQIDKRQFSAYLTAISKAAAVSVIAERARQEKGSREQLT
jgi:hypothetical protein